MEDSTQNKKLTIEELKVLAEQGADKAKYHLGECYLKMVLKKTLLKPKDGLPKLPNREIWKLIQSSWIYSMKHS